MPGTVVGSAAVGVVVVAERADGVGGGSRQSAHAR